MMRSLPFDARLNLIFDNLSISIVINAVKVLVNRTTALLDLRRVVSHVLAAFFMLLIKGSSLILDNFGNFGVSFLNILVPLLQILLSHAGLTLELVIEILLDIRVIVSTVSAADALQLVSHTSFYFN